MLPTTFWDNFTASDADPIDVSALPQRVPLTHKQIEGLIAAQLDTLEILMYRQATVATIVNLSADMAAALGTGARRLTPFLATIIDVVANKLEIDEEKIKIGRGGASAAKALQGWLGDDAFGVVEHDLWRAVSRDARAYLLTEWDADEGMPEWSVVGAYDGMCGAACVEGDDGDPVLVWNTWSSGDSYFDAYYPDRIEKYVKPKTADDSKAEWQPRIDEPGEVWPVPWVDDAGEPLGIALTEFAIDRSDIADALQIGRDMNEALLDMLASSRTQGWPQRYLKGQRNADVLTNGLGQPVISSHTGRPIKRQLYLAPGSVMLLSEGSELDQLDATKPDPTLLDKLLELLSFVTTVPSHYFKGEWPSGVALVQAESRLNHKIEGHQCRLSGALAAALQLALRLSNYFAATSYAVDQPITVPWHAPQIETEDLRREREAQTQAGVVSLVQANLMSRDTALRTLHPEWTDEEIDQEVARLDEEKAAGAAQAAAMAAAQPGVQQNGNATEQTTPAGAA